MEWIVEVYKDYAGSGVIVGLYLASILYLYKNEQNKNNRIFLIYMPLVVMVLFFNPLFISFIHALVGDEIYYRFLWLLPMSITLSYVIVKLINKQREHQRKFSLIFILVGLMFSGTFIYKNQLFSIIENEYHMPQSVVDICDYIHVEGREIKGIFPDEMLAYVRQYDATIHMPYGREMLIDEWAFFHQPLLYNLMNEEVYDITQIAPLAKALGCHYLILIDTKEIIGSMEEFEYIYRINIEGYDIYQDTTIYAGL